MFSTPSLSIQTLTQAVNCIILLLQKLQCACVSGCVYGCVCVGLVLRNTATKPYSVLLSLSACSAQSKVVIAVYEEDYQTC